MKKRYKFLYKSGVEDEFIEVGTEESFQKTDQFLIDAMSGNVEGVLNFGASGVNLQLICISDISRAEITLVEATED